MAQFLTSLKKSTMQAGERRFAELLEKHLDDEYLVWYNAASPVLAAAIPISSSSTADMACGAWKSRTGTWATSRG